MRDDVPAAIFCEINDPFGPDCHRTLLLINTVIFRISV